VVSSIAWSFEFLPAAAYYWHCGRIECMVLSTAAVSCGSQSVLSTMGQLCLNKQLIYNTPTRNEHILDLILTNVSKYYKVPTM
jgi:hypothetical protein